MRGKHFTKTAGTQKYRITPADAGKTHCQAKYRILPQDHPRGCGENRGSGRITRWATGSPPRMRGKRTDGSRDYPFNGITPADAGKTFLTLFRAFRCRDHPRGCGENFATFARTLPGVGSPPRMRGKPSSRPYWLDSARITPADAGKTLNVTCAGMPAKDHPRGCGENMYPKAYSPCQRGSPPRMRGKLSG